MTAFSSDSGIKKLQAMMSMLKDNDMPIRIYRGYYDDYLRNEEHMTPKLSDKYVKALESMFNTFTNRFDNFEQRVIKNGKNYIPFWR